MHHNLIKFVDPEMPAYIRDLVQHVLEFDGVTYNVAPYEASGTVEIFVDASDSYLGFATSSS